MVFSKIFIIPHLRALSENHLTIVRNRLLGPLFGRSWALLAALGRAWGALGTLLGCLGELLRRSWYDHGTLWGVHETIWGALGGFSGLHWTLWGALEPSWVDLG